MENKCSECDWCIEFVGSDEKICAVRKDLKNGVIPKEIYEGKVKCNKFHIDLLL